MVDFGKLFKKGKALADEHGEEIARAVDKVTDVVDDTTKGKHAAQLAKVDDAARKLDRSGKAAPKSTPKAQPKP